MIERKYICSCSFGKDSLAMLLRLIEENKQVDEVIFYDTGMEFESIYNNRDRIKLLLEQKGIKYTELTGQNTSCMICFADLLNTETKKTEYTHITTATVGVAR